MRLVVSNTGPFLHLGEINRLDLLMLTGELHIPRKVEEEVKLYVKNWDQPSWVSIDTLSERNRTEAIAWQQAGFLDSGEAEAISLARQLNANWLLTDDTPARLLAQAFGFEVHGSLGVVLWAAAVGHLKREEAITALEELFLSSLWISAKVVAEARVALNKIFGNG